MLPFEGGTNYTLEALCDQLGSAHKKHTLEGLTLLGGEPTAHAKALAPLALFAQNLGLDVLLFSGSTHEELLARNDPYILSLLNHTDILVDGPYQKDNPEPQRRFIGSANQRILRLSERTPVDDPRWKEANTLELRLENRAGTLSLTVNGFPAPQAMGLWKRVPLH
jgi:anaerobic ribonucleoside-triphosphate reductase activating protein